MEKRKHRHLSYSQRMREEEETYKQYSNLVDIVINRHYAYLSNSDKEDALMIGLQKAYALMNNGNYDETRPLVNYLYTGIRNEIGNFFRKANKPCLTTDMLHNVVSDSTSYISIPFISREFITENLMYVYLTEEKISKIEAYLNYLGLETNSTEKKEYIELDKEVTILLWRKLKS